MIDHTIANSQNPMLAAALELAVRDEIPVFPCTPDKTPYTRNGFKDASCDAHQIENWWRQHPDALIGVPTGAASSFSVLDLDCRINSTTGEVVADGMASLKSLMEAQGLEPLPDTWSVRTPSGGMHYYFMHEEGFKCSAGQIAPGIDTRGDGGYVIAAPSPGYIVIKRKTPVKAPLWLAELFRNPRSLAVTPQPLLAAPPYQQQLPTQSLRLYRSAYVLTALNREAENVAATAEGARNSTLNAAAFKMGQYVGSMHLDGEEVTGKLLDAARRCGLSEAEAAKTIGSGMKAGAAQPKEPPPQPDRQVSTVAVFRPEQESGRDSAGSWPADSNTGPVANVIPSRNAPALPKAEKRFSGEFWPADRLFDPWTNYTGPDFPLDIFPTLVRSFVVDYSLDTGADQGAIAMSCLATLSGAISHGTRLRLSSSFNVGPRLWVLIVGRSSSKKTPAMTAAVKPLREIQDELRVNHRKRIAELKRTEAPPGDIEDAERDKPPLLIANNVTVERLQDLLSRQDRGILMHSDELATLLGSMDRYGKSSSPGGDKAFYLEAYNGGPYDVLRLTAEDREIKRLSVSILGGIQPKKMNKLMNLADDGFLQRFLPVMIGQMPKREARDVSGVVAGWSAQVHGVFKTAENGGWVALSPEAEAEFKAFEREIDFLATSDTIDNVLEEFVGKLSGVWGSMCLILHLLHGSGVAPDLWLADNNAAVSGQAARAATRLMREFVIPHGQLFYHDIGDETRQHLQAIGAYIAQIVADGKTTITARDLMRGPSCFKGMHAMDLPMKIRQFIVGGWLEPTEEGDWCRSWFINPAVKCFGERAAKHRERADDMLRRLTPVPVAGTMMTGTRHG